MSAERLPPHDVNAERAVIGCILRDNQTLDDAMLMLKPESFYTFAHQKIFQACVTLTMNGGVADPVPVADWLHAHGLVPDVRYDYIADVFDSAPCTGNVAHYAEIVRDKAILREVIRTTGTILESAFSTNGHTAQQVLEGAERKIYSLSEIGVSGMTINATEAARRGWDLLEERIQQHRLGQIPGVRTGLGSFDRCGCCMQPGELVVIAARTSVGKTAMMLNILRAVCQAKVPAFAASLEQKSEELELRLWSILAKVDSWQIRRGKLNDTEINALHWAKEESATWPLEIDDTPGATVTRIAANARRLKRQGKLGIIFIDYLQMIECEDRRIPRHEQVAQTSRRLKLLAQDLGVPVVVLAQLNREADKGEAPKLSHLRDSGAIEQDADTVILMHQESAIPPGSPIPETMDIGINVAKQRNGPTVQFLLKYHGPYYTFEDYDVSGHGETR